MFATNEILYIGVIALDLSAALDTSNYANLKQVILNDMHIKEAAVNLIMSYLSDRTQSAKIKDSHSSQKFYKAKYFGSHFSVPFCFQCRWQHWKPWLKIQVLLSDVCWQFFAL